MSESKKKEQTFSNSPFRAIKKIKQYAESKSGIKGKFDTIIFNAPYLPQENSERNVELEGGKTGNEVIARFLEQAKNYLKPKGKILLAFSSLTPIKELFEKNLFAAKELAREHYFFEDILVCELSVDQRAIELEKKGIKNLKYFAKGKRGIVFTANYGNKNIAVKMKKESSETDTIMHEANMLKEANKHKIGPKYIFNTKNALVYEFVKGKYLKDLINSKTINKICKKVFEQCYKLDSLGINKQEMTRPMKHVIVGTKITLIDFERARKAEETHNVTQFCQFVGNHVQHTQKKKWIELAKEYASNKTHKNFENIIIAL